MVPIHRRLPGDRRLGAALANAMVTSAAPCVLPAAFSVDPGRGQVRIRVAVGEHLRPGSRRGCARQRSGNAASLQPAQKLT